MKACITTSIALASLVLFAAAATQKTAAAAGSSGPAIVKIGDDMRFTPATVVIHRGQSVTWQNASDQIHNVVDKPAQSPKSGVMSLPKNAAAFDSGWMIAGQTYVQSFPVVGTYKYACTLHMVNRMVGEVIVK